jgi:caa(3)-type oxidase subunit IV
MAQSPTTTHATPASVDAHAHGVHPYITLFFILLNFTLMEYFYAKYHGQGILPFAMLATAIGLNVVTAIAYLVLRRVFPDLFPFNRKWVYLTVLPALLLSFFPVNLIVGLVLLAVTKAALVGLYFMHIKYEGKWIFFMLIPTGIMALIFTFALYPDIGLSPEEKEPLIEDEDADAPSGADSESSASVAPRPNLLLADRRHSDPIRPA